MPTTSIVHLIARELGRAMAPLREAIASPAAFQAFMLELGWSVDDVPAPIQGLATALDRLDSALVPVVVGDGSPSDFVELLGAIRELIDRIEALRGATFDARLAAAGFATKFPGQLVEYLLVAYLMRERPRVAFLLSTLGVIRSTYVEAASPDHHDHVRRELLWADFPELLSDPVQLLENAFGWRTDHLAQEVLLRAVTNLALSAGLQASLEAMDDQLVQLLENQAPAAEHPRRLGVNLILFQRPGANGELAAGLKLLGLRRDGPVAPGFALLPYLTGDLGDAIEVDSRLSLSVSSTLDLAGGLGIVLRPDTGLQVMQGLGDPATSTLAEGSAVVRLVNRDRAGDPIVLMGIEAGSRLEYRALSLTGGVRVDQGGEADLFVELLLEGARLIVKPNGGDTFLKALLPADGITAEFQLAPGLSRRRGFYFSGSGRLEIEIPVHRSLGPVELRSVTVGVKPNGQTIPIDVGAAVAAKLGPLTVLVEGLGLTAAFSFPGDNSGVLGPIDLEIGFKPPDTLGLVVDAGPVTGGGFLKYEEAAGRYVGALELEVYDIAVKAFGILDTRMPGGLPPYSFVILVSTEFTPIPIGFGFTLKGVGGLAGIHRRMAVDEFRERLGKGTLDHLLFPAHPVEDAPVIVSDLQAVFPPAADRYVFGPMALIAWGGAGILEGKLGILLEIPAPVRLVLLGQFSIVLPRKDHALVTLNLDVVGELEPSRQRLALDGRLHDSDVVGFRIEGGLAVRVAGGSRSSFALSIGGFHPSFTPPAGFPKLQRITVPIGLDDDPRVTLEGYLALTSNTLQIGALATVYAEAGWFNITGHVGFDALFTFSPFSFVTDFSGKVALNKGSSQIAAIKLEATISGPSPWHVAGEACLEIRWLPDICVGVHATFGEEVRVELPTVDPFPLLRDAVANPESWSGERPLGVFRAATTAAAAGTDARGLVDPAVGVTLRQTVVPLDRRITRFGASQPPGGALRFDIGTVRLAGDETSAWDPVQDLFAPAQFEDLSDDEKLSRPDFERMDAGLTLGRDAVALGQPVSAVVVYETRIVDSEFETRPGGRYHPTLDFQLSAGLLSAAALSALRGSGASKFAAAASRAPLVSLAPERFVVVSTADLLERHDIITPAGKGAACQALAVHLASHPEDRGRLEVVSIDELSGAA